jgi:uncharacterized protein
MNAEKNKKIIEGMFNGTLELMDYFAEDGVWVINGIRSYHGKKQVLDELLLPFGNLIASMGKWVITNMIAEGDHVAAEMHAVDRVTKTGLPYNNNYCVVCKFDNGKITRLAEYCDTDLLKKRFPELKL